MNRKTYFFALLVLTCVITLDTAFAQGVRRDDGGDGAAAAKAQYLLRQLADERDALKSENAVLQDKAESQEKKMASLSSQLKGLKKSVSSSSQSLEMYKQTDELLRNRIEQQREKMNEMVTKFKEVVATFREVEHERNLLLVNVTNLEGEIKSCADDNVQLYEAGLQILDEYENKGVWSAIMQKDVVTGLKTVEIENTVEKYRHRLRDEKYFSVNEM